MKYFGKIGESGDTIIEVMISVAVVGLVLGVSYGTASKSLKMGQEAQERGEALKIAESNLEELKYISQQPYAASTIFAQPAGQGFCIASVTSAAATLSTISGYNTNLASDNFASYVAPPSTNCRFDSSGAINTTYSRYNVAITYEGAVAAVPTTKDTFTITVRWDSLNGQREEVKSFYRIHP
jgi:Tfp pilus assembly protein PilE